MVVNKIGAQHLDYGKTVRIAVWKMRLSNLCAMAVRRENTAEVGAKAYRHLANLGYSTQQIFQMLVGRYLDSRRTPSEIICALRFWRSQSGGGLPCDIQRRWIHSFAGYGRKASFHGTK